MQFGKAKHNLQSVMIQGTYSSKVVEFHVSFNIYLLFSISIKQTTAQSFLYAI
jgi:hypothetical protein